MLALDPSALRVSAGQLDTEADDLEFTMTELQRALNSIGRSSYSVNSLSGVTEAMRTRATDLRSRADFVEQLRGFDSNDLLLDTRLLLATAGDFQFTDELYGQEFVDEAVDNIEGWLTDNWHNDITDGDLDNIADAFGRLSSAEASEVLGRLTDEQLRRLFDEMPDDTWFDDGWSDKEQHNFLSILGAKVSLEQWTRLAAYTEMINPDLTTAGGDSAADDELKLEWLESLEYVFIDAPLFANDDAGNSVGLEDLNQGRIGNCYFITAEMALAQNNPDVLGALIHENDNGTFTVTFANGSHVTVSPTFAVDKKANRLAFTNNTLPMDDVTELWPLVLEKAYAQYHEGWDEIVGGWPANALDELVGTDTTYPDPTETTVDDVAGWLESDAIVTMGSLFKDKVDGDPPAPYQDGDKRLVYGHAYLIVDVDVDAGTVTVANPWNPDELQYVLTEAEFQVSVSKLEVSVIEG